VQLEVTEREFVRGQEAALTLLEEFQRLGFKVALDDFGTGMSSLGCLRTSPFDVIKIDRSFVHDLTNSPDGLAVIHAAVNLIENLGMVSVAEGVETPEQVAILQSLGCRFAQGYLFGEPMPVEKLMATISPPQAAFEAPPAA
jgi:EAL domain-containing protein (putative c-di-GMP-specific phosphodiesterase class I)